MPHAEPFARAAAELHVDPVLGGIPVSGQPTGGQGLRLDETGALPSGLGQSIMNGQVASDGSITAGTGFTVNHSGTGVYVITYDVPFSVAPTVSGSAKSAANPRIFGWSGTPDETAITVQIRNASGSLIDEDFSFIAMAV